MKLVPLTPADVFTRWDWLRAGILHCLAKTSEKFRPEDVYHELRSNNAWAFAFHDDADEPIGFMVLQNQQDSDGPVMFVWVLWCPGHWFTKVKDEIYAALEQLARTAQMKRIRMQSSRVGWSRERFFRSVAVVYEHEVDDVQDS